MLMNSVQSSSRLSPKSAYVSRILEPILSNCAILCCFYESDALAASGSGSYWVFGYSVFGLLAPSSIFFAAGGSGLGTRVSTLGTGLDESNSVLVLVGLARMSDNEPWVGSRPCSLPETLSASY